MRCPLLFTFQTSENLSPASIMKTKTLYPDCYLHIEECRSGQTWIVPIRGNAKLDLVRLIKRWAKQEFAGELILDGQIMPRLQGDYYAVIYTDGRPPGGVCWTSGGFYLKGAQS